MAFSESQTEFTDEECTLLLEEEGGTEEMMEVDLLDVPENEISLKRPLQGPTEVKHALCKVSKQDTVANLHTTEGHGADKRQDANTNNVQPLRAYQVEISERILAGHNDLIILPTGSGKTRIATNLIQRHLAKTDKAKVLFLAPGTELVKQQYKKIKQDLGGASGLKCFKATGTGGEIQNPDHLERILTGNDYEVIVATPGVVVNYLMGFSRSNMTFATLIIFDEVHHSKGKSADYDKLFYRFIYEKLSEEAAKLPQLVGLTATVGVGSKAKKKEDAVRHLLSQCALLDLVTPPTEAKSPKSLEQLERFKAFPIDSHNIDRVELERTDPFSSFLKSTMMAEIKEKLETKLSEAILADAAKAFKPDLENPLKQSFENTIATTQKCLDKIITESDSGAGNKVIMQCKTLLAHLKIYHNGLKNASIATCKAARECIEQDMQKEELKSEEYWQKYKDEWSTNLSELSFREMEFPNPKLLQLRRRIDEILNLEHSSVEELSRIMVFVERREVAGMISRWLNEQSSDYRSARFVSTNSTNDMDNTCMSQSEATEVMGKFRRGELNILVATSVLGEGIDIPACNGVIRYLFITDAIAEKQIPGRVRARNGKVVAIVDEDKHAQYVANKPKVEWMTKALETVREMDEKEFNQAVLSIQQQIYRKEVTKQKKMETMNERIENSGEIVKILCRHCSSELGRLSDLFQYFTSHFLNMDPKVAEKIEVVRNERLQTKPIDGIEEQYHLRCRGTASTECLYKVGKLAKVSIDGEHKQLATWKIERIKLVSTVSTEVLIPKKYADIDKKFGIKCIHYDTLGEKAEQLPLFEDDI